MNISIEQARALDAIYEHGTFQKAAQYLGKGHSAVMYLIKTLESETQLTLLDRSGYRNHLTPEGHLVHKYCRQLLQTTEDLSLVCNRLQGGWEPRINLIYDGVIDFNMIADVLLQLNKDEIPTEIKVSAAHLDEVETLFANEKADMMLTILPNHQQKNPSIKLKPIKILLVAHKDHELNKITNKVSLTELINHTYIRVRGSTTGLALSTEQLEVSSIFIVNDFFNKKQALLKRLGYGWLPEYMIHHEIKNKTLKVLNTSVASTHYLYPRLYYRHSEHAGKGAATILKAFKSIS